jgi:hypothetical protein
LHNNAMGANVCEQLANVSGHVAMHIPDTVIKCCPLTVILLVNLPQVSAPRIGLGRETTPFRIGESQNRFGRFSETGTNIYTVTPPQSIM